MTNHGNPLPPVMQERTVALLTSALAAIGPISMALYTPAMPEIATSLSTSVSLVKFTLVVYFGGFALAQLVAGPVSDSLGRRAVTLIFFSIYAIAAFLALAAPNIEVLLVARFLQGIGASAGMAIARAIVRDLYQGDRSSKMMNLIGISLSVGAASSPTLGSAILIFVHWRAMFVFMLAFGLAVLLAATVFLKETAGKDRPAFRPVQLFSSYGRLIGNRRFVLRSLIIACTLGTIYAQTTFLPFVLMDVLGLTPEQFGLSMIIPSALFIAGSLLTRYGTDGLDGHTVVGLGIVFIACGSTSLLLLHFLEPNFYLVMLPLAASAFGIAFVMPNVTTATLAPFPRMAGTAAALLGFLQMAAGLLGGTIGTQLMPIVALATVIPVMGYIACASFVILSSTRRNRRRRSKRV